MRTKLESELENIKNAVEMCIKELVDKFKESPYMFYTEHDMHCYLYHLIYRELYEKQVIEECCTSDGEETIILHKEYPPIDKEERRPRGRFDITILDPASTKRIFSKSRYRNLRDSSGNPAPPFIAIELALDYDTDHLSKDHKRLTNPKNKVKHGYILHFMRDIDVERRQKKKRFKELLKKVEEFKDEGKVKIWYLDVCVDKEIKSEGW